MSDDEPVEEVCGESYDHDLDELDRRDGWVTYTCRECGAELQEEELETIGSGDTRVSLRELRVVGPPEYLGGVIHALLSLGVDSEKFDNDDEVEETDVDDVEPPP